MKKRNNQIQLSYNIEISNLVDICEMNFESLLNFIELSYLKAKN